MSMHAFRMLDKKPFHNLDATHFFVSGKLLEWVKLWYGSGEWKYESIIRLLHLILGFDATRH